MDRDELAALDAAATNGPCEARPNHWGGHTLMSFTDAEISDSYVNGRPYWKVADTVSRRDADLLAYLRNHVPDILALIDENARLREALQSVLNACDQGRMVELGAGGMTIEAQIRRSVYNRVPAWPIEEARSALSPNPKN